VAIRPMKDGVIANFEVAEKMLQHFIRKAQNGRGFVSPRVIIGIPPVLRRWSAELSRTRRNRAKASQVFLVEEAVAAAIGAGLPISRARAGNIVVDIGGGTTISHYKHGRVVYSRSVRVAGDAMDEAIRSPAPMAAATASSTRKT